MPSRRVFLGAGLGAAARGGTVAPELILHGGNMHTADAANPHAEAVAIAGGRLLAVGSDADVLALATGRTKKTGLGGKTVVPGFIDAHTHVAYSGLRHLRQLDCDLRSIAAVQAAVRERAGRTPKGEWIVGFKYDDTKTSEGRKLTRADLDAAAPEHPVLIEHRGGHTAFVNSLAMRRADVNEKTPDPPGGQFDRDGQGRLTGGLKETAVAPFRARIPDTYTREERREAVKLIARMFARAGVTSVHDALGSPADLASYQDARAAGELCVRVYHLLSHVHLDRMIEAGVRTGLGDEWVRVGAVKLMSDGSISERTARLEQPYAGRPDDFGIQVMPEEELYAHARKAHAAGWQVATHANGDAGIDVALRVYERLQREMPRRDPRKEPPQTLVTIPVERTMVGGEWVYEA